MPHGHCYLWNPGLVWLHVISDSLIALAYYSIPFTLVYFVRKRKDLAFHWIFLCFAVFIIACGTTHVMEIWSIWHPTYWLSGGIKALTALASVPTACLLIGLLPKALALPSRKDLGKANQLLENEIVIRKQIESELRSAKDGFEQMVRERTAELARSEQEVRNLNADLEQRVHERTAQLENANRDLENEIAERRLTEALLRESEERFRALVLGIHDFAIYWIDPDGRVAGWNSGAERIKGYQTAEIIGKSFSIFYTKEDAESGKPQRLLQTALAQGRVEDEGWRIRKDGTQFWANVVLTALRDEAGQLRGFAKITRDVTERKFREKELQKSQEALNQRSAQLEAANKELEAFSYSVSHDLRAPLRAIDGFGLALQEDCADFLNETGQKHVGRIRDATRRMGQLIDGLLELSKVTRIEMSREPVRVSTLAEMIIDELRNLEPQRSVELSIQPGLTLCGDPRLLRAVLENLLANAWKFTRKNPIPRIEFGASEINGQRVFFVRDNGAGFDMAYADKLFGAFQRLHPRSEFEGTGIGLATVQRIIHRHGGRVWAESATDKGATFYFTLPGS